MYFTDAHEELRLHIRKFLAKEVQPHLEEREEKTFPDSIFQPRGGGGGPHRSGARRSARQRTASPTRARTWPASQRWLGDSATSSSSTAARRSAPTAPGVTGRWSQPGAGAREGTRVTTAWSSK